MSNLLNVTKASLRKIFKMTSECATSLALGNKRPIEKDIFELIGGTTPSKSLKVLCT